jgi:electron transport complex protein RnfC
VVVNVATLFAIQEALFKGLPLTRRVVTVSGGAVARPRNLWVPIGTPLRLLLEECGGLREEDALLITGGPMMGVSVPNLNVPVLKNTNSLLALSPWERNTQTEESVCIRCGKCVSSCPMHLSPVFIRYALQQEDPARLRRFHPEDCITCGCCSYICPANIPLVQLVARAKAQLEQKEAQS